jgi:Subtilase family.
MKRIQGILAAALLVSATPVIAAEYIVKLKNFSSEAVLRGVEIIDSHETGGLLKVDSGPAESSTAEAKKLAALMADPNVEYVVENFRLHALTAPFDAQGLKEQWAITKVNAEAAWTRAGNRGSRNVIVAVIDTGTDYSHESLAANAVAGYDFKDTILIPWI